MLGDNPDEAIKGCTQIIQSGREAPDRLAIAYEERA
jgi:hypothetical protein